MRINRSSSDWQEILSQYPSSGLTIKNFCIKYDISKASFYHWSDKLGFDYRRRRQGKSAKFIEVATKLDDSSIFSPSKIKLSISNQLDLEFTDNCKISPILEIISLFKKC